VRAFRSALFFAELLHQFIFLPFLSRRKEEEKDELQKFSQKNRPFLFCAIERLFIKANNRVCLLSAILIAEASPRMKKKRIGYYLLYEN